jgi:hypothetical protein
MHTLDACKTDGRESQSIEAEASNFIQKHGSEMLRAAATTPLAAAAARFNGWHGKGTG